MDLKICYIKTGDIIAPGSTLNWYSDLNYYNFIETSSIIDVEWRKYSRRLNPGDVAFGRKIRIHNPGSEISTVRGIVFHSVPCHDTYNHPAIFESDHKCSTKWKVAFNNLLDGPICKQKWNDGETTFNILYESMKQIKHQFSSSIKTSPVGKIDRRLILVNRYIRNYFTKPLTLQNLADLISCNPVYLSNSYSKVFGFSPIQHLQNLKMVKAGALLTSSDKNIKNITKELGYISSSQFAELFKRHYGMTPTEYRRNAKLL